MEETATSNRLQFEYTPARSDLFRVAVLRIWTGTAWQRYVAMAVVGLSAAGLVVGATLVAGGWGSSPDTWAISALWLCIAYVAIVLVVPHAAMLAYAWRYAGGYYCECPETPLRVTIDGEGFARERLGVSLKYRWGVATGVTEEADRFVVTVNNHPDLILRKGRLNDGVVEALSAWAAQGDAEASQ